MREWFRILSELSRLRLGLVIAASGALGYYLHAGEVNLELLLVYLGVLLLGGGASALNQLQEQEFASESRGYTAHKHQREVGAGYFDAVTQVITGGNSSITALAGSTEEEQFEEEEDVTEQAVA